MANETIQTAATEQVVENNATEQVFDENSSVATASGKTYAEKIKAVQKRGGKRYNGLKVRNVCVSIEEEYVRITFVTDKAIPGNVLADDGETYKEGLSNNIFTSSYAIAGMLKEDEENAWLANEILAACNRAVEEEDEKPLGIINLLFNGAIIDVLSEHIAKDTDYFNPFTTKDDPEATQFDHDTFINNVVKLKLGKTGQRAADKLMDKLLGF